MAGATREGIISANLGGVPLADVARECRLSTSHFQRASIALLEWRRNNGYCRVASRLPRRAAAMADHRYADVALGVRLQRSEPPHASLQPIGRHKSGRMGVGRSTNSEQGQS